MSLLLFLQLRIIKEENVDKTSSEEIKEAVTEIDTDGDSAINLHDLHDLHPWPSTVDLHPWPSPSTSSISSFWSDEGFSGTFSCRNPCYFNTGVMVIDLVKWRRFGYTKLIERWMQIQKSGTRIYELGSLPSFLLVFAGNVAPIDHRWNQHGLGGDNVRGSCRDLHPGPVSLLHWSGSGKPWPRLDSKQPCPLDTLWAPYDLYGQ
ncbi:hypothetical protein Vadar_031287 [Vaccinium darrowii]|uniref:Uncharacterized protein n=1 Tax=Vaccinium darrowii TaxID=229202 RepID=A0ACB7Z7E2_9ERIC|nr:hypothetical protein Vadar_031287 [Vaccinium darrowii]